MTSQNKSPPKGILRLVLEHQRWLNSNGRYGSQLQSEGLLVHDCNLDGFDFSHSDLSFATFVGGSIRGCRFFQASLFHATFEACDVDGADFSSAGITCTIFATNHERAVFGGANLEMVGWSFAQGNRIRDQWDRDAFSRSPLRLKRNPVRRFGPVLVR